MDTKGMLMFIEKINREICSTSANEEVVTGEFLKIGGRADAALLHTRACPFKGSGVSHTKWPQSIASRSSEMRRSGPLILWPIICLIHMGFNSNTISVARDGYVFIMPCAGLVIIMLYLMISVVSLLFSMSQGLYSLSRQAASALSTG